MIGNSSIPRGVAQLTPLAEIDVQVTPREIIGGSEGVGMDVSTISRVLWLRRTLRQRER